MTACASSQSIPAWFDSLLRYPVHTITIDGARIAYLDHGSGPPVILIHGFSGSIWQWEYQQEALAKGHRVLTLDCLGSGWSDKPDIAYTPTKLVEFVRTFMDALGISRATLVGNSMGAGVVLGVALTHPTRVDRVVLIAGLPANVAHNLKSPMLKRALTTHPPTWLARAGHWLIGKHLTTSLLQTLVFDQSKLTPLVLERASRNRQRPGVITPLCSLIDHLPQWEQGFAQQVHHVTHPTLIIWGTEDSVFPTTVGHELQARIPHAMLSLVPEAGHLPQWEQPGTVNALLLEFIQSSLCPPTLSPCTGMHP